MTYILKDKNSGTYFKYFVRPLGSDEALTPVFEAFQKYAQRFQTREEAENMLKTTQWLKTLKMKIIHLRPSRKTLLKQLNNLVEQREAAISQEEYARAHGKPRATWKEKRHQAVTDYNKLYKQLMKCL
jgi:hypothetical protein